MIPTKATLDRNKVILIVCDGMRADGIKEMGFLNSLCENSNIGQRTVSRADNPSVSRTNYTALLTGTPSLVHGITSNLVVEKPRVERNILNELVKNDKTTAIIGSSWFYDLFGKEKYSYIKHKEITPQDAEHSITHGRFYRDDAPDSIDDTYEGLAHTFQTSDLIIYKYTPDFVLIHVLTPDEIGHAKGIGKEYKLAINAIDGILGATIPRWLGLGYDIVLTADHGMDENDNHGGSKCSEVLIPLYFLSKKDWKPISGKMHQIDVAPIILDRILPGNDFRAYRDKLIQESGYKHSEIDCMK